MSGRCAAPLAAEGRVNVTRDPAPAAEDDDDKAAEEEACAGSKSGLLRFVPEVEEKLLRLAAALRRSSARTLRWDQHRS